MDRRQLADLDGIEDAEDVELSFLGKVGGVGEESVGNAHECNIGRRATTDEG
jgi:hypothetical protein